MSHTWAGILYVPKFVSCEYSHIFLGNVTKYGAGNQNQHHPFPSTETAQDACCPWKVEVKTQVSVSFSKRRRSGLASTFSLSC